MEIICRILQQHPLRSQQYTDRRTGEQKTMNSIGFELASGADTLFAELTGDAALRLASSAQPTLPSDHYYKADLSMRVDAYQSQTGDTFRGVITPYLLSAGRSDLRLLSGDAFSVSLRTLAVCD